MSFRILIPTFKPVCKRLHPRILRFSTQAATKVMADKVMDRSTLPETSPPPVRINVQVDPVIMKHLNIPQGHRKVRVFVSSRELQNKTVHSFREMLEKRVEQLSQQPYRLQFKYTENELKYHNLERDDDLRSLMRTSLDNNRAVTLKLNGLPGIFPPTSESSYIIPPCDPSESPTYTMVSFFSFKTIEHPKWVQEELFQLWKPMQVLGRIYVAHEGINAQMAIPSNIFEYFKEKTKSLIYFEESRFNTDPEISREEYERFKPFRNLHIRIRSQIVADGLDEDEEDETRSSISSQDSAEKGLDWRRSGKELLPLEWHESLSQANNKQSLATPSSPDEKHNITILDCRNSYESDVGLFQSAIPLNTTSFRESWKALDEILANTPKDQPIYTYCTGGIRCVKINAYLEQKLGFNNTYRLQGGIIAYRRELERLKQQQEKQQQLAKQNIDLRSQFRGVNFVFDERIGERITDEVLSFCESCGSDCDTFHNCPTCNVLFIQCSKCSSRYQTCCSLACLKEYENNPDDPRYRHLRKQANLLDSSTHPILHNSLRSSTNNLSKHQRSLRKSPSPSNKAELSSFPVTSHALLDSSLDQLLSSYSEKYSEQEPTLLEQLRKETEASYPATASRMLSGPSQGAILSLLATLTKAQNILELGSFTGYSALSFATSFDQFTKKVGDKKESGESLRQIYTCEIDKNAIEIARKYFDQHNALSSSSQIYLNEGSARALLNKMKEEQKTFDLVFIDADKKEYLWYLKELMGENTDNMTPTYTFLTDGAFVVIDNTLWKGLVLKEDEELKERLSGSLLGEEAKERYQKIAKKMHEMNAYIANHQHLRQILLPLRDGLSIIQFKSR